MLADQIFEWAGRTPHKAALVHNDRPWSYAQFAREIAAARSWFARQGLIGPGFVALALEDQSRLWPLGLALRSLGLTIEAFSEDDLRDQKDLVCVVTSAEETSPGLQDLCASAGVSLLIAAPAGGPDVHTPPPPTPPRLGGHVLHTSGTTGSRKKVLIEDGFEETFLARHRELSEITGQSAVTAFNASAWTGAGYKTAACAWAVGATCVIEQRRRQAHRALLWAGLTHALLTPIALRLILAQAQGAYPLNPSLHLAIGGGTVAEAEVEAVKARISPLFHNGLGATEVSTFAITRLEVPEDRRWHRLLPGREVQIVDDLDRPVPVGVIGRLRVSTADGPNGYLNDEAATASFFKAGFFYTGDLGVIRDDGRLALQGRVTEIINIAGVKISPAPIEERLEQVLGVGAVVLFSMQDAGGDECLHVVVETAEPLKAETLMDALSQEIATVPGTYVHCMAELPRNEAGKVVREAAKARALSAAP